MYPKAFHTVHLRLSKVNILCQRRPSPLFYFQHSTPHSHRIHQVSSPITGSSSSSLSKTSEIPNLGNASDEAGSKIEDLMEDLTTEQDDLLSDAKDGLKVPDLSLATPVIKPRNYQLEMLEESLKRNVIVAMDTGSGKTHIAVLRILHELDRIPPHQFIWFLAPTVSLCAQQFETLKSQISAVQMKFLSGVDGVDRWTEPRQWNALLKNVKVVVSTYQILLDALDHGFVEMSSLALIVFDEAHNCTRKHPGAKLMLIHYHKRKLRGESVPHILGLSASPIMRSDPLSLNSIEATLDSICRTPTEHRAELRLHVNLPTLTQVYYENFPPETVLTGYTKTIESLGKVFGSLMFEEDPFVIGLLEENGEKSRRKLEKVRFNHKTWCHEQIKTFYRRALTICHELGAWAADYYISKVISNSANLAEASEYIMGSWEVSLAEKKYLAKALEQVEFTRRDDDSLVCMPLVSDKVTKLIKVLVEESSCAQFSGIVFVQERATVGVLARILSIHPETREIFKVGSMIGTSTSAYRRGSIAEFVDLDSQKDVLSKFKSGAINLVIATSVLEEGIDIPACNVVVCFQKPANLKSFVQRRGRARQKNSKLILLLDSVVGEMAEFRQLELDMKAIYEDEMRTLTELLVLEDGEDHDSRSFTVAGTGAYLDFDNVLAHLYHFCSKLPAKQYVDLRPEFICSKVEGGPLVRARVTLPRSVDEAVRTTETQKLWQSEKNAIKDAAFEAYVALYKAGLVNDHLLPLLRHNTDAEALTSLVVEKRASIMVVKDVLNPWIDIAKKWKEVEVNKAGIHRALVTIGDLDMEIFLPVQIPPVTPFRVYWDSKTELLVKLADDPTLSNPKTFSNASKETLSLLKATFGARFSIEKMLPIMLFSPRSGTLQDLMGWQKVTESRMLGLKSTSAGLIRDETDMNIAFVYNEWLSEKPPMASVQNLYINYALTPQDSAHLSVTRFPKRYDFLHPVRAHAISSNKPFSTVLPASDCTMDIMPFKYVQFGLLVPSIIHRFEVSLLAEILSTTILKEVDISNLSLVIMAICSSSAREDVDYQRMEFFGDAILKLCTAVQLMAEYPLWPEGYLSSKKDLIVSNTRLSRAAVEAGLDRFIIAKVFTGNKWRPLYVEDLAEMKQGGNRKMSSKVLADVVEALIGAAMEDGGIPKALACLHVFLPELNWQPLEARQLFLYQRALETKLPPIMQPLETLVGYEFKKKSLLLEAMTHGSCVDGGAFQSFERFEFLGDAILDNIIVTAMYPQDLSHYQMHLLRTALVNADFLASICMEWSVEQESSQLVKDASGNTNAVTSTIALPLWRFMRHSSPGIADIQKATMKRHAETRSQIQDAIASGTHYPWVLLARLQANKVYSDIVESLLAAVWIDSGSFATCTEVVERMGILSYFRRILSDGVKVLHPKEELGVLVNNLKVKYVVTNRKVERYGVHGLEYSCELFVDGKVIVDVDGGWNKEEITTKAAEEAIRLLKERMEVEKQQE